MNTRSNRATTPYPRRSALVQRISPAPKRHLQTLVSSLGLRTGLDVGCGAGSPLTALRGPGFRSTGIDLSPESVSQAKCLAMHDECLLGDVRTFHFQTGFDVVVLSHVIEHFERDEGLQVLRRAEELAARLVYVETPYGFLEQHELYSSVFQRHLSGWFPADFEGRGYTVFGSGSRRLHRRGQNQRRDEGWVMRTVDRLSQRWYFRRPDHAHVIAAIRLLDSNGNVCTC